MSSKSKLRTAVVGGALIALGFAASGCASHRFVRDQVEVVDNRVTQVEGTAGQALQRANDAHKLAEGKFLYQVVLSDDALKFPTGKATLSSEAEERLTALADRLKGENKNVYVEVQGHTDATGSPEGNIRLGADRAEAVRRYLNKQGVALNRIATIAYGEDEPVAPNDTREGRMANRRVVLVVLS